jgi:hypothetical protein
MVSDDKQGTCQTRSSALPPPARDCRRALAGGETCLPERVQRPILDPSGPAGRPFGPVGLPNACRQALAQLLL